jgi:hypothetical protein
LRRTALRIENQQKKGDNKVTARQQKTAQTRGCSNAVCPIGRRWLRDERAQRSMAAAGCSEDRLRRSTAACGCGGAPQRGEVAAWVVPGKKACEKYTRVGAV